MKDLLSPAELAHTLPRLTGWNLEESKLVKRFQFEDFVDAMAFVNEVAQHAETVDHHPNILIYYNKVVLELISHDVSGISKRDIKFCQDF